MTNVIVAILILFIVTILIVQFTFRYVYNYRVSNTRIEIVLFGKIPIKSIPFSNIVELRKMAFKETLPFKSMEMFLALRFGNRVWGQIVSIQQKKGLIKTILISPDNADRFIEDVQGHLQGFN